MKYRPVLTWEEMDIAKKNGIHAKIAEMRIIGGWDRERAITEPVKETIKKKYKEYADMAKENGIPYPLFYKRVHDYKWDPKEAAITPKLTPRESASKNRIISTELYALAERNGISKRTLQARILVLKWEERIAATLKPNYGNRVCSR
ncbi:hypothetical protein [Bacillus pseudomycoides]|uniref:hypothetical protein n=1 Tax=Bacillus pseudomycoides TaxID=64104 RepID=UPI003CEB6DF4